MKRLTEKGRVRACTHAGFVAWLQATTLRAGRRGFTLAELLVTITIIAILAAMMMGAVMVARSSAREAATKATIAKLHNIIMAKYESYRTRRVPIDTTGMSPTAAATARLQALRDLMRMEMPERWTDIQQAPIAAYWPTGYSGPTLYQAYRARCYSGTTFLPSNANYPAKCLYLIVTMAGGEDARHQFHENEIARDADGFYMFVDGWGHPIYFLRWAPGFNDSDLQGNVSLVDSDGQTRYRIVEQRDLDTTTTGLETAVWNNNPSNSSFANVLAARQSAAQNDHDPFDPRRVDMTPTPSATSLPRGWRLVPLIYSAGPDGEYGVAIENSDGSTYWWTGLDDHYFAGWGLPTRNTSSGSWVHFDNIHNHRLEVR
jgi:prepilin-type N-terminal cleavage/methylation domain-containing protein